MSSNKVNIENLKDTTFSAYKQVVAGAADKKGSKIFKDKSYFEEYRPIYLFANALKYALSFFSICTVFIALNFILEGAFHTWVSIAISGVLCLGLEGLKNYVGGITFKHQLKYTVGANIFQKSVYFSLALISLSASIYGAYKLPEMRIFEHDVKAPLIKSDSVNVLLAQVEIKALSIKIDNLNEEIKKTSSNGTKRKLSDVMSSLIENKSQFQNKINYYESSNKSFNDSLSTVYNRAVAKSETEYLVSIKSSQIEFAILAFLFELLLTLSTGWVYYYYYRNEVDKLGNGNGAETGENGNTNGSDLDLSLYVNNQKPPLVIAKTPGDTPKTTPLKTPVTKPVKPIKEPNRIGFHLEAKHGNRTGESEETFQAIDQLSNIVCASESCNNSFNRKSIVKIYCSDSCKGKQYRLRLSRKQD